MTPITAEQALYQDLLSIYARAGAEVTYETDRGEIKPYWPKRFLQAVKRAEKNDGLIPFVSRLVSEQEPSRGFFILKKAGRLDLTVEALICDRHKIYWREFDFDILDRARRRLSEQGYDSHSDGPRDPEVEYPVGDRLNGVRLDGRTGQLETCLGASATGMDVRHQTVALLRAKDEIGVAELLRTERSHFDREVIRLLQHAGDELDTDASPEALKPVEELSWGLVERRLGSLLPIMEYQPAMLAHELKALSVLAARVVPTRSSLSAWRQGARWPVWLVSTVLGTTAVAFERPEMVVAMWSQRDMHGDGRPLPVTRLAGGLELGEALLRARPAVARLAALWYPAFRVCDSPLLREAYPEIMSREQSPDTVGGFLSRAGDFFWLCGALGGRDRIEVERYWAAEQVHPELPTRLRDDPALARLYGQLFDTDADDVVKTLRGWLDSNIAAA